MNKKQQTLHAPVFIAERSKTEEALQLLARRLLHAQEDERQNVAKELHDSLTQSLAMLGVEVGIALNLLPPVAVPARQQLHKIRGRVETLSEEVRQLSRRLNPPVLEQVGLVSALRSYCNEFSEYQHVHVVFVREGSTGKIALQVGVCLYRIVQEALRNAARHARATEIVVTLTLSDSEIRLAIADNGRGFDAAHAGNTPGMGLVSMEERARIVGGRLSIDSHPGAGTRIEIVVPA